MSAAATAARIGIIGGGPGGLATAIALRCFGFRNTHVFEASKGFNLSVGSGFGFAFNGLATLRALGLKPAVASVGVPIRRHLLMDGDLALADSHDPFVLPSIDPRNRPTLSGLLRPELSACLLTAQPEGSVKTGKRLKSLRLGDAGASQAATVVTFEDGSQESFDIVIGADGIHSAVREALMGPSKPTYSGVVCLYSVAAGPFDASAIGIGATMPTLVQSFTPESAFVAAPTTFHHSLDVLPASIGGQLKALRQGHQEDPHSLGALQRRLDSGAANSISDNINDAPVASYYYGVLWESAVPPGSGARGSMTGPNGGSGSAASGREQAEWRLTSSVSAAEEQAAALDKARDLARRGKLAGKWGEELLEKALPGRTLAFGLHSRIPVRGWSKGNCVLIGDAVHAPLPTAGQGANMAVEDAWALASCLAKHLLGSTAHAHIVDGAAAIARVDNHPDDKEAVKKAEAAMAEAASSRQAHFDPTGAAIGGVSAEQLRAAFEEFERLRFAKTTAVVEMSRQIAATEVAIKNPAAAWLRTRALAAMVRSGLLVKALGRELRKDAVVPL